MTVKKKIVENDTSLERNSKKYPKYVFYIQNTQNVMFLIFGFVTRYTFLQTLRNKLVYFYLNVLNAETLQYNAKKNKIMQKKLRQN